MTYINVGQSETYSSEKCDVVQWCVWIGKLESKEFQDKRIIVLSLRAVILYWKAQAESELNHFKQAI